MGFPLSTQTVVAISRVICGFGWNRYSEEYDIGVGGSKEEIEAFIQDCGLNDFWAPGDVETSVRDALRSLNNDSWSGDSMARSILINIIESAIHLADYRDSQQKLFATHGYLNDYLQYDGFILQKVGTRMRLLPFSEMGAATQMLWNEATTLGLDTVERELDRIRDSLIKDPEDAITAACAIAEGVCRSILVELKCELPNDKTLSSLYKSVKTHLHLSPGRDDLKSEADEDIRAILGALSTLAGNIGALRTKVGDAHGRERGHRRVDARIARLAVNASSTLSLFLLETWQLRYPMRPLPHDKTT